MKQRIAFLSLALVATFAVRAQSLTGKLIDENHQPLPYANIVLLSLPDSAFVAGVVSGDDGTFTLNAACRNRLIRISSIGYTTLYKECTGQDLGILQLQPDAQMLGEVVVKADLPKVRIKGDAQVTTVQGSILEQAGTGNDLLNKLPGVSADEGTVNVGSGEAEIYINGRKMRDASELDQLESDNIKRVEVVRNPGARYDATVQAVVRIYTKRPQGEGFGFNNRFLPLPIRLDCARPVQLQLPQGRLRPERHGVRLKNLWRGEQDAPHRDLSRQDVAAGERPPHGLYQREPLRHAVAQLPVQRRPLCRHPLRLRPHAQGQIELQPHAVGCVPGRRALRAEHHERMAKEPLHQPHPHSKTLQDMNERYIPVGKAPQEQRVTSYNKDENTLYAAKLIISRPLWEGNLSFGGEYTYTDHTNTYINDQGILDSDYSNIEENAGSAFLEYARSFGKLQATAGVRYEHITSDYYENDVRVDEQSRTYDNVFPTLSLSLPVGKTQLSLSYTGSISRPSYYLLRSNITYANRYTYEGGNPLLRPSLIHRLSADVSWKWIYFNRHPADRGLFGGQPQHLADNLPQQG